MSHMLRTDAGLQVRHARWAQRLSIRELADKASVSTTTVMKIEKGELNVLGQVVYAVADALDLDASTLFEAEPEAVNE